MATTNPPATNDILEVKYYAFCNGQLGLNVRHYKVAITAGTGALLAEIAETLSTTAAPLYKDLMSNDAQYRGVSVQSVYPTPTGAVVYDTTGNDTGTVASQVLPTQVSGIITLHSAFAGRSGRGRAYVPFPASGDAADDNTPSAGYVSNLNLLGAFLTQTQTVTGAGGNSTVQPILIRSGNLTTTTPFISYTSRNKWATQRRRGSYGQANTSPI